MMLSKAAYSKARPLLVRTGLRSLSSQATNPKKNTNNSNNERNAAAFASLLVGLLGAGTAATLLEPKRSRTTTVMGVASDELFENSSMKDFEPNNPPPRPDLPTIPLEEVAEHADEESLWYTFRGGVYDLTFFINQESTRNGTYTVSSRWGRFPFL